MSLGGRRVRSIENLRGIVHIHGAKRNGYFSTSLAQVDGRGLGLYHGHVPCTDVAFVSVGKPVLVSWNGSYPVRRDRGFLVLVPTHLRRGISIASFLYARLDASFLPRRGHALVPRGPWHGGDGIETTWEKARDRTSTSPSSSSPVPFAPPSLTLHPRLRPVVSGSRAGRSDGLGEHGWS